MVSAVYIPRLPLHFPSGPTVNHGSECDRISHHYRHPSIPPSWLVPRPDAPVRSPEARLPESSSARSPVPCWSCGCGVCADCQAPGAAGVSRTSATGLPSPVRRAVAEEDAVVARTLTTLRNRPVSRGGIVMMCGGHRRCILPNEETASGLGVYGIGWTTLE